MVRVPVPSIRVTLLCLAPVAAVPLYGSLSKMFRPSTTNDPEEVAPEKMTMSSGNRDLLMDSVAHRISSVASDETNLKKAEKPLTPGIQDSKVHSVVHPIPGTKPPGWPPKKLVADTQKTAPSLKKKGTARQQRDEM
uniref:Uncharacterized protein n=1 Tax=Leersia perrieri TaxID=77586 RepID=A0A0D9WRK3_9ORYZ